MEKGKEKIYTEYYTRALNAPRRRWRAVLALAVGLVLFSALILFAGVAVTKWEEQNDSGVVACQAMADNVISGDTRDDVNTPMTEAMLNKAKGPWKHSQYAELRIAGINVVTTIYELDIASSKSDADTDVMAIMSILRTLRDQWTALQIVCAQHKVDIPDLPME